jgi:hypothetical protein
LSLEVVDERPNGSADRGTSVLGRRENEAREQRAVDKLLRELNELRELDRQRHAHVPGSAAFDAATLEVDIKSRRLFDRFRSLKQRRARRVVRSPLTANPT